MAWFAAVLAVIFLWRILPPRIEQFVADRKVRKSFLAVPCPACGRPYNRTAVRRAVHGVKTKMSGGPPPASFAAHFYEVWELRCGECGHVQDFDPARNLIFFEEGPSDDAGERPRS